MKHRFIAIWRRLTLVALAIACMGAALAEGTGAAVINQNTYIFQNPSLSSAHIKIGKGTGVELVAVRGQWAMVKKGGVTAYMNAAHVSLKQAETSSSTWEEAAKKLSKAPAIMLKNDKVYKSASTSAASLSLAAGTTLNLVSTSGDWALVEKGGVYAYTSASSVASLEALKASAVTASLVNSARAYKALSPKSASVSVSAGTSVKVLAVIGSMALVEKGGVYAYIAVSAFQQPTASEQASTTAAEAATSTAQATQTQATVSTTTTTASDDYFSSSKYTNEQKCFIYMTKEMKLNTAAACGILASARRESSFNPGCTSSTGKYYGLFQWSNTRLSNLKSFCSANGLGYNTVEGQMKYMRYELENTAKYASLLKLLQTTPNTAQGAYDAAYQFCYIYERPANIVASSEKRGVIARDTYFPKYNK